MGAVPYFHLPFVGHQSPTKPRMAFAPTKKIFATPIEITAERRKTGVPELNLMQKVGCGE